MSVDSSPESIWSNKQFRKLFASVSITSLGGWFDIFAIQIIFAYSWHASPMLVGFLFVAYVAPGMILGQFAGVLADRYNKKSLLIRTQIVCGVLTVFLLLSPYPYLSLGIVVVRSCIETFWGPAQGAFLKEVVPPQMLLKANAVISSMSSLAKIIGPLLGAAIIAYAKPQFCLLITAIGFFISAATTYFIAYKPEAIQSVPLHIRQFFKELSEGWRIILRSKMLRSSCLIFLVCLFFAMLIEGQVSIFLREIAPHQPDLLGHLMAVSGLGALLAGIGLSKKAQIVSYRIHFGTSIILLGFGYVGLSGYLSVYESALLLYLLFFVGGVGLGWLVVVYSFVMQHFTGQALMGRVGGISASIQCGAMVSGPLIGGALMHLFKGEYVFGSIGILLMLFGLGVACLKWTPESAVV